MNKRNKLQRTKEELDVLTGVIDYADRMVYEEGQRAQYEPLRRHAYGKTVVIDTEKQGTLTFRLSSTPAVYPSRSSGYATPHSPVGRLCAILQAGDKRESRLWGGFTVSEVRLFDRFEGAAFEPNVRNFLRMELRQKQGKAEITNLRAFLNKKPTTLSTGLDEKEKRDKNRTANSQLPSQLPVDELTPIEPIESPAPNVALTVYEIEEDEDEETWMIADQEEGDEDQLIGPSVVDEYFGLSETFYLDRTPQQDQVISRSPIGAMYVEGVAGSGKTSAALGRTKMLCDYNTQNVSDEEEFRDIVGESGDYWSGKFAGQFSQESSVGFVRTGELIQYLKETCRRLDLPNLPIQEYPELRSRLRQFRQVEQPRKGSRRWSGLDKPRGTHPDTTMTWLKAADRAIAHQWAAVLVKSVPTVDEVVKVFKPDVNHLAAGIVRPAIDQLRSELASLSQDLIRSRDEGRFALDGLAKRINRCIESARDEVLGPNTFWVNIGEHYWHANSERQLAKLLISEQVALYLRTPARLVFFDENGLVDPQLTMLSQSDEPLASEQVTKDFLVKNKCLVRDESTGEKLLAVISDVDDLYFRLLPESAQKLYVQQAGKLKKLQVQRKLGQKQLPTTPAVQNIKSEPDEEQPGDGQSAKPKEQETTSKSVRAVFSTEMRRSLLNPLGFLADAYAGALQSDVTQFPDKHVAIQILEQLNDRKLSHEDIDLLLCLFHLVGRGFEGNPQRLTTTLFYQSVFIDEVQDFTEQQVYLMSEQARPEYSAVTVVGDSAQKLHNGGRIDVRGCFPGKRLEQVQLSKNMRQAEAPGIAWFSARFRLEMQGSSLGEIPDDELLERLINAPDDIRGPELLHFAEKSQLIDKTVDLLKSAKPKETAVVILPTEELATKFFDACKSSLAEEMVDAEMSNKIDLSRRHVRHFTSINNAKGLEFDLVILPYFEHYDLTDIQHQNQMYVGLTRAKRRLVLIGHEDRPPSAFDHIWQQYLDIVSVAS